MLSSPIIPRILILFQFMMLLGVFVSARTYLSWIWTIFSFVPSVIICLITLEKRYTLSSLVVLFISQQAILILANPTWGFSFGSDAINDFHTASVMSEAVNFELGNLGYSSRLSYSYYPMIHLASMTLSKISGVSLVYVAMYFIPVINALLVVLLLYLLNHDLFGLEGRERNFATMFFEMSFYYTAFDSQFVRETFAFPLVLLCIWTATRTVKTHLGPNSRKFTAMMFILFGAVALSHHISSYLLFVILGILAISLALGKGPFSNRVTA